MAVVGIHGGVLAASGAAPDLLKRYLAASLRSEEAAGRLWPFSCLMEMFFLQGVKAPLDRRGPCVHGYAALKWGRSRASAMQCC